MLSASMGSTELAGAGAAQPLSNTPLPPPLLSALLQSWP